MNHLWSLEISPNFSPLCPSFWPSGKMAKGNILAIRRLLRSRRTTPHNYNRRRGRFGKGGVAGAGRGADEVRRSGNCGPSTWKLIDELWGRRVRTKGSHAYVLTRTPTAKERERESKIKVFSPLPPCYNSSRTPRNARVVESVCLYV